MSIHLFGNVLTPYGTAANNRAENEGNTTTLQKLVWGGATHSSVSAEAIRFALRRRLAESELTNRGFSETARENTWRDPEFQAWLEDGSEVYIDDDILGFMSAKAGKSEEAEVPDAMPDEPSESETLVEEKKGKGKAKGKEKKPKAVVAVRRGRLEVTRAISLTPWAGDVTFNAASPGATPSAAKKGASNPVPYATELHATRYQYGFAITPEALRKPERAQVALRSLASLGPVAGNHGRFYYDFSPDAIVLRITHDPAPRFLHCFTQNGTGFSAAELARKVEAGDIPARELLVGGSVVDQLRSNPAFKDAFLHDGVIATIEAACARLQS